MIWGSNGYVPLLGNCFQERFQGLTAKIHLAATLLVLVLTAQSSLNAASLPTGFIESLVASGLSSPTAMAFAPDGRLFVCEQTGQLRVIKNSSLLATSFLTVSVDSSGERGLLGVAFDPDFTTNQFIYIYYTTSSAPIHNRVSRFTANGDVAVPGSERVILELDNLSSATNHNGGAMHFGLDSKLYIAVGENANSSNSQTLSNLLGKLLRLNADGTIPTNNPFYNAASGNNRAIWALGLRNPFTFAFQPGSGRLFINDVGQNIWEEINDGIAGKNYGWPTCEGLCIPPNPSFQDPFFYYANDASTCAITGGTFYNPDSNQFPNEYVGEYFFADYCAGWIHRLDPSDGLVSTFGTGISFPVDLHVGLDGSLYYLARGTGTNTGAIYQIQFTGSQTPQISQQPASQTISVGQPVTFSVSASGSQPLSYQWQRNGANIIGATSSSYTISSVTSADNGAGFRAIVSNLFGSATSNIATLTVTANNAPTGTITAPQPGTLYSAGDVINYAGTGTDPEDGNLPASAFTWEVVFHHDTHTHPFIPPATGATSGSFTIPNTGETSANVWYRIHLTVRDSGGLTHASFRDVLPRKATITLQANPSGLQLTLDGQPHTSPYSELGVDGIIRTLGAISPQNVGGVTYIFDSWSDGGAITHSIVTPDSDTTYTAIYRVISEPTYTLTASPGIVGSGGSLTINWSAPSGRPVTDWIGLYKVGDPNTSYQWWHYTNGATSGSFTLNGPSQVGQYEFRYLLQDGYLDVARSNAVIVGDYSLTANPSASVSGGSLTISWTTPSGRPTTDWIGLYRVGDPNTSYRWWQYTNGATSGSFTLSAPNQAGQYEFRYLLQDGYSDVARSNTVTVNGYSLTANPSVVVPGSSLTISWTAPAGTSTTDWIGLFKVDDPNTSYGWWQFTNGATSGSFTLSAPSQAGQYEFRYLLQNGYNDAARSNVVTVGDYVLTVNPNAVPAEGALTVTWSAPSGRPVTDWIGLYKVDDPNGSFTWWHFTNGATSGSFTLSAPSQAGQYEFRYLLQDGYSDVARSSPITVN